MKRISTKQRVILGIIFFLGLFLLFSQLQASALEVGIEYGAQTGLGSQDIRVTIAGIIRIALGFLGLVAVALIIYGGFLYMTAEGMAEKIEKAKKLLIGAVIGLVIILSAFAIASFIISQLVAITGPGVVTNINQPPPSCVGTQCIYTPTYCPDPNPNSLAPFICKLSPTEGKKGTFVTIKGGKFASYDANTSKVIFSRGATDYQAEIASCNGIPAWSDTLIVIEVPNNLLFTEGELNLFDVFVINAKGTSEDKPTGGLTPNNQFTLLPGVPGPGIACIVPSQGPKDTAVDVYGKRFGATLGISTLRFWQNINATINSWADDHIASSVPGDAISGDVFVRVGTTDSNGYPFYVTCASAADCLSACCSSNICQESQVCAAGPGQSCDTDTTTPACQKGACQPGLYCRETDCTCQPAGLGALCDADPKTTACDADNNLCGEGLYCSSTQNCSCQYLPRIDDVKPDNGAPGNYVTLAGRGFGTALGKVIFLGTSSPDDDKEAILPTGCGAANIWQDNQVIIEIPQGAVTGPLKLINAEGQSDTTSNATGWKGNFGINEITRPGLCSLTPNQAEFGTLVTLAGKNFGSTKDKALIGGQEFDNKASWVWSDKEISQAKVPNLQPATLPVQVQVNLEYSNPFNFTIKPSAKAPKIDYIDPVSGPIGQYVTIFGSNFGSQTGLAKFLNLSGETNFESNNWLVADTNFPASCTKAGYWHDNYIVVKVPAGLTLKDSQVVVKTSAGVYTNTVDFNLCQQNPNTCPLRPGICAISPNQGPVGTQGVTLFGENFGSYLAGISKVNFWDGKAVTDLVSSFWNKNQVGSGKLGTPPMTVPAGATTGPVQLIDQNGVKSNKIQFEVSDCRNLAQTYCSGLGANLACCQKDGVCKTEAECAVVIAPKCDYAWSFKTSLVNKTPPTVIDDLFCESNTQSPSPYLDTTDACSNAMITARFDQEMDLLTLNLTNITVLACGTGVDFDDTQCTQKVGADTSGIQTFGSNTGFIFTPQNSLVKGTWYKVTLNGGTDGISSASGVLLDGDEEGTPGYGIPGGDYTWHFKIKSANIANVYEAEACALSSVTVSPPKATISIPPDPPDTTQELDALALAANCNLLNGNLYNWYWYKKYNATLNLPAAAEGDIELLPGYGVAKISRNDLLPKGPNGYNDWKQYATPIKQGQVLVIAMPGQANFSEEQRGKSLLTVDFYIPIIDRIYPTDGLIHADVNTYITIYGSNFGKSQGSSHVFMEGAKVGADGKPELVEAKIADCAGAWSDNIVKIKVPLTIKDGSHVTVITSFGQDISKQTFTISDNIYPFLCELNPDFGKEGTAISVSGDNLGDSNKTTFVGKQYGVGSYMQFFNQSQINILQDPSIKSWANRALNILNPIKAENALQPELTVFASIDPRSEPYNDANNNGIYDSGQEEFADTNNNSSYDKATYSIENQDQTGRVDVPSLASNDLPFYMAPIIMSISPNNGPVKQWVTISGNNFGAVAGKVYFYNKQNDPQVVLAELAPCSTNWTNNYIIAIVPNDAQTGGVYIETAKGIPSNKDKNYTVNNKPLGAGLCELKVKDTSGNYIHLDPVAPVKEGDDIYAIGDRFGDPQEPGSNLVFNTNVEATVNSAPGSWTNKTIHASIPTGSVTGNVVVTKKVQTGKACAGFHIGSFCPSNKYDTTYETVPSNPISITITGACISFFFNYWGYFIPKGSFDSGFPILTSERDSSGNKVPYPDINMNLMASDGKYLYTMAQFWQAYYAGIYPYWFGPPINDCPAGSTLATCVPYTQIYKIGTGFGNTELGRVYKKYSYDYKGNSPAFTQVVPVAGQPESFPPGSLVYASNGNLYLGKELHAYDTVTKKWIWYLPRAVFNEINNTYSLKYLAIPKGIVDLQDADYPSTNATAAVKDNAIVLASNGTNIFAIAGDLPGDGRQDQLGYTIQVLDNNLNLIKQFGVKSFTADTLPPDVPSWLIAYLGVSYPPYRFMADSQYLYLDHGSYYKAIDLKNQEVASWSWTMQYATWAGSGTYDWVNKKFWMGSSAKDDKNMSDPTPGRGLAYIAGAPVNAIVPQTLLTTPGRDRIYRYTAENINRCLNFGTFCRSDNDCNACGTGKSSCINGLCTPYIQNFSPLSGATGTWVTLNGCYFGCDPGQVYFWGTRKTDDIYKNNEKVFYQFEGTGNDSSGNNYNLNLYGDAAINNGVLNLDGNGDFAMTKLTQYYGTDGVDLTNPGNAVSVSAWVKIPAYPATGSVGSVVSQGGGNWAQYSQWAMNIGNTGAFGLRSNFYPAPGVEITKYTPANAVPLNKWVHLTGVLWYTKSDNKSHLRGYINGTEAVSYDIPGEAVNLAYTKMRPVVVGATAFTYPGTPPVSAGNVIWYLNGQIDDVRVYNRVLTAKEVTDIYYFGLQQGYNKLGLKPSATNPACWDWQCSLNGDHDQIIAEVPNKNALSPDQNAQTGPIRIITANGLSDNTEHIPDNPTATPPALPTSPNFEVNDVRMPGICNLIPDYGNSNTTVKIVGQNFGEAPAKDNLGNIIDYVNFTPSNGTGTFPEPWNDELIDGVGNNQYDAGESFIDIVNPGVYDTDLNSADYTFKINSKTGSGCPLVDGWDDKNICFGVPETAAGYGTGQATAVNDVNVAKGDLASNSALFNVTFGACGNGNIDLGLGEECDGTNLPSITNEELFAICKDLFGEDTPLEQLNACYQSCNNTCGLKYCIGNDCRDLNTLCGNQTTDSYPDLNYTEECDTPDLGGKTCPIGTPGNLSCTNQCKFDTSGCQKPAVCTTDDDCNACGSGVSRCDNGQCTPYIESFTPTSGAIGTKVALTGCYFGCDPGQVYFLDQGPFLQNNLAYYRFTADASDSSLNNNDGKLENGATVLSIGVLNVGGGTQGFVSTPLKIDQSAVGKTATFCGWAYPLSYGVVIGGNGSDFISTDNGGYDWAIDITTEWRVATGNNYWSSGFSVDLNTPQHVCAVFDTNKIIFYKNGIAAPPYNQAPGYDTSTSNLFIGINPGFRSEIFNGLIDEVIIFNRALSAEEIGTLYSLNRRDLGTDVDVRTYNAKKGLTSNDPACKLWSCSAESEKNRDKVVIEVPDKNTPITSDDATTGPLLLTTSDGLECTTKDLTPSDYTVNDVVQPNVCIPPQGPAVQATVPYHTESDFCRNGWIDIYFDSLIDPNTVEYKDATTGDLVRNFSLADCSSATFTIPVTQNENKNLVSNIFNGLKDIFKKLVGYNRSAIAQDCTDFSNDKYSLKVGDINNKTIVSLIPNDLLKPGHYYRIKIKGGDTGVKNPVGGILDNTEIPPFHVADPTDYLSDFKTLGTENDLQSGICNVEWIDVNVYRQSYASEDLANRPKETRNDDLFICAGKDNCLSDFDYDQDASTSGNQHIYEAVGKHSGNISLKANYVWSKTDGTDPQKSLTIYNDRGLCTAGGPLKLGALCKTDGDCGAGGACGVGLGDTDPSDAYKVKNSTGLTYVTAAPIKEATAKLVVEAQAQGSFTSPAQKEFLVYTLLCENPWPSLNEKFPISSIINAYNFQTYYCRDTALGQPLLPAARYLTPEGTNLSVLQNTDFESGNLSNWINNITGSAFNFQPVFTDLPSQRKEVSSSNIQGAWWLDTYEKYQGHLGESIYNIQGTTPVGVLSSQDFLIKGDQLKFLIGGSNHPWPLSTTGIVDLNNSTITGVTAVIFATKSSSETNFTVRFQATGNNTPTMTEQTFDIPSQYKGQTGIIYIYDNNMGGYITFDDLRQYSQGKEIPIEY